MRSFLKITKMFYAPKRQKFIENKYKNGFSKKCIFCNPEKQLIVSESKNCYVIANKYPYATGHLLVLPKRHINSITELTKKEREELFDLIDFSVIALKQVLKPHGYNIGSSVGKVAGESIHHLHFHVLPRFEGDMGWNILGKFEVFSLTPKELVKKLKQKIIKNKLKNKFNIF